MVKQQTEGEILKLHYNLKNIKKVSKITNLF